MTKTISVVNYNTQAVYAAIDHTKCVAYVKRRIAAEFASSAHLPYEERGQTTYFQGTPFRISANVTLELDQ